MGALPVLVGLIGGAILGMGVIYPRYHSEHQDRFIIANSFIVAGLLTLSTAVYMAITGG